MCLRYLKWSTPERTRVPGCIGLSGHASPDWALTGLPHPTLRPLLAAGSLARPTAKPHSASRPFLSLSLSLALGSFDWKTTASPSERTFRSAVVRHSLAFRPISTIAVSSAPTSPRQTPTPVRPTSYHSPVGSQVRRPLVTISENLGVVVDFYAACASRHSLAQRHARDLTSRQVAFFRQHFATR